MQRLLRTGLIQAKLTINPPGDRFEQEADRVADQLMRMEDSAIGAPPHIQRKCSECEEELQRKDSGSAQAIESGIQIQQRVRLGEIQRLCDECENETTTAAVSRDDEEEVLVQTKLIETGKSRSALQDAPTLNALKGRGQPLPIPTRSFFERRLGHDFGNVRVHTDARAGEFARSLNARAFTHGNHIVFRPGEYALNSSAGRHLLAHELTHTIQQGASPSLAEHGSGMKAPAGLSTDARRSAVPSIQRVCEVTAPPADLVCPQALSSTGSGTPILFGIDGSSLTPAARSTLSAVAAAWHTGGRVSVLRIDGFASCDGPAAHNWRLSCRRAQAVATELEAPSDGSPGVANSHISVFANGETDQFSTSSLPPNRRAVITSGGSPPPGPACGLTITGPDEVDHFCAAYVPSDAAACGVFPAPSIALTVAGAAPGASLRWSVVRGGTRASIVGPNTGASINIQGDAASGSQGDVTVQVTDGICTATHFLTVRQPSSMPASTVASSGPTFVQLLVTYTVLDQFGNPMGANICWDETVTTCANSHPGPHAKGDVGTNANGQVTDRLRVAVPTGTLPASLCQKFNQVITVGGCGPLAQNTIVFQSSGARLNQGSSCVAGDPCP